MSLTMKYCKEKQTVCLSVLNRLRHQIVDPAKSQMSSDKQPRSKWVYSVIHLMIIRILSIANCIAIVLSNASPVIDAASVNHYKQPFKKWISLPEKNRTMKLTSLCFNVSSHAENFAPSKTLRSI